MFSWLSSLFICFFIPLRTISSLCLFNHHFHEADVQFIISRFCVFLEVQTYTSPISILNSTCPIANQSCFPPKLDSLLVVLNCVASSQCKDYTDIFRNMDPGYKSAVDISAVYLIVKRDTLGHKGQLINHLLINNNCSQGSRWDL